MELTVKEIHVHVHTNPSRQLEEILAKLTTLTNEGASIMATLDEVLAEVTAQTTEIDGVTTLIKGLEQHVTDLLAGEVTPAGQAKIDALFATLKANGGALNAAVAIGTPPAPVVPADTPAPTVTPVDPAAAPAAP